MTARAVLDPPTRDRQLLRPVGLACAVALLAVVVVVSIAVGTKAIALGTVLDALHDPDGSEDALIVRSLRVPRTVLGLAVGAALGVAGVLMQGLTRNPMAEPGILGVSAGAALAAVLGFRFGLSSPEQTAVLAAGGAALAGSVVYALGSRGRQGASPVTLALAGVAMAFLLQGLVSAVVLLDADSLDQFRFWNVGALADRGLGLLRGAAVLLLAGALLAVVVARPLDLLALGEETARGLGVAVGRTRLLAAAGSVLLVGGSVALCGPLAFVGLVVPHLARAIAGPGHRWLLAYAVVLGPLLVLVSDVLGRVVVRPGELQAGIVTALVGAPFFVHLARRQRLAGL
ncbi:MAG TPA: iron ABC transporter permease [Mycobacteriales bacterium]|jgi:iron complex transport system permease protein|nr:iron ABC transporter permease [Mycobacteriales bacterium]